MASGGEAITRARLLIHRDSLANAVPKYEDAASPTADTLLQMKMEGADIEACKMNAERSKLGFFMQVSGDSELSGVSTTYSLEELSSPEFFSHQCTEIDAMASRVVDESSIREVIRAAVTDCEFCVTIADPRSPNIPLIAVSEKFEKITGYGRAEVLGKNCRFLNTGCVMDPTDLMCLRHACSTGAEFTAVLTNRRKSGDLFLNLLDLRGLTVAQNPCTGEELWFLVGIQADVTNVGEDGVCKDRLVEMHEIASGIRNKLADELSAMAVAGALMTNFVAVPDPHQPSPDAWCLLPVPVWRQGDAISWPYSDAGLKFFQGSFLCSSISGSPATAAPAGLGLGPLLFGDSSAPASSLNSAAPSRASGAALGISQAAAWARGRYFSTTTPAALVAQACAALEPIAASEGTAAILAARYCRRSVVAMAMGAASAVALAVLTRAWRLRCGS